MQKYADILNVIRDTGRMTLPHWGNSSVINQKGTHAVSVVTAVDEQVEQHLAAAFSKLMPDVAYVGEEFGGDRTAERFWLVDPIDGTGHYVRGLPYSTTMVAMIEQGQVVFGAIYDFVNDIMYHAVKGGGAFANNTPIHVSNRNLSQAYVCYETKLEKPENLEKYLAFRKRCVALDHICSGYEHALVASGKLEGRIGYDPYGMDYDFAPGTLLIAEAGGIVTNIGTTTYDFRNRNYIATNKTIYAELTAGPDPLFPIVD